VVDLAIVAVLIVGIGLFRAPGRARWGNLAAALALGCALLVVVSRHTLHHPALLFAVCILGGGVAWGIAFRVNMTQIPAMVAFQNGAGGLAAFLVSSVELTRADAPPTVVLEAGILGLVVGAATFSGSMVASGKLANLLQQKTITLPKHDAWILGILVAIVVLALAAVGAGEDWRLGILLTILALGLLLGVILAIRVGGADMPVLISFLNASSGLAAALCGIMIQNRLLIACGATVAASGSILTHAMCRAMNRNLRNVFVGMASVPRAESPPEEAVAIMPDADSPKPPTAASSGPLADALEALGHAQSVIIVPGYGMALAHAQSETVRLAEKLQAMGHSVKFVVHPIAGRMPGHMHVLLAEADVDPDLLFEMEEVNPEFEQTDLALIVGACDVVNPAATRVEDTPISGMPILLAENARRVLVCNLDSNPGYSGVENPLYTNPKTIMILGDAKETIAQLLAALD